MLNDRDLFSLLNRVGVNDKGRRLVATIRESDPQRRVKSTSCSVACKYPSQKMGFSIQAESRTNELAFVILWEHDSRTHEMYDQPPPIRPCYRNAAGKRVSHDWTLDYFLIQEDFVGFVECKTERWLLAHEKANGGLYARDENGRWRSLPGEAVTEQWGLGLRVCSDGEINARYLRNIEFLTDYYQDSCPMVPEAATRQYLSFFKDKSFVPLREFIDGRTGEENDLVYKLIADGVLTVDLDRQLLSDTDSTLVFRDQVTAATYFLQQSKEVISPLAVHPVQIVQGEPFLWDGKSWRVVNVGENQVFAKPDDGPGVSIPKADMEELVRQGSITGAATVLNGQSTNAEALLLQASEEDLVQANYRYRVLTGQLQPEDRTPPDRVLRRWRQWQRDGIQLYGSEFLGLIRLSKRKGNRTCKLYARTAAMLNEAVEAWRVSKDSKSKKLAWGALANECENLGLKPPSEKTFLAAVGKLSRHSVVEAQEGSKAAYDLEEYIWIDRSTPRHGERPFQIAHIDHTQVDIQLHGRKFGGDLAKPWLTLLFDAFTRSVLAISLSFDPPSYRSCMAVFWKCIVNHGRVPYTIVSDSGAEFESTYYETMCAAFRVIKKTRAKGKPRYGTVIERWFGVTNTEFVHCLRGNNTALQKPRQLSKTHDPRTRAVWTLPAFSEALGKFIDEGYHAKEHPALGVTPKQAMEVGMKDFGARNHQKWPVNRATLMLCLPSTPKGTAKVIPGRGVCIFQRHYWCDEFREGRWENTSVPVRYNPQNIAEGFAYLGDRWVELRSEYADVFEGHSEREIEILTAEIRGKDKRQYRRRGSNAKVLANALMSARVSEAVLLQRQHDEELQNTVVELPTAKPRRPSLPKATQAAAEILQFGNRKPRVISEMGVFE